MGGKGWLKKLLEAEPTISKIEIEGLNEPCYSLDPNSEGVKNALRKTPRVSKGFEKGKGKAVHPKGKGQAFGKGTGWPSPATGKGWPSPAWSTAIVPWDDRSKGKGKTANAWGPPAVGPYSSSKGKVPDGKGKANGKGKAPGSAAAEQKVGKSVGVDKVMQRINEDDRARLSEEAALFLQDQEFLEGNKIVKMLMETSPEVVVRVKAALGGKGWLKNLLELEPTITQVQ